MNLFHLIDLQVHKSCIGPSHKHINPARLYQFIQCINKHASSSHGYLYNDIPNIHDFDKASFRGVPGIEEIERELKKLRRSYYPSSTWDGQTAQQISIAAPTGAECPLLWGLLEYPASTTHFKVPFCSIERFIQPALKHVSNILFIDRYLELNIGADDTSRLIKWIKHAPNLLRVVVFRQFFDNKNEFIQNINDFASKIPSQINARIYVIADKGNVAFHARYLHTDRFTLSIEAGLDKKNLSSKETDISLLNPGNRFTVEEHFNLKREQSFRTLSIWEKPANQVAFQDNTDQLKRKTSLQP